MPKKLIDNQRPQDGNISRNLVKVIKEVPRSILPNGFVTTRQEMEVIKWALMFYMYTEKNQKLSGRVYLSEITEDNKKLAEKLLKKLP